MPSWAWLLVGIALGVLGAVVWLWISLARWSRDS
jgi:hypothetical protein